MEVPRAKIFIIIHITVIIKCWNRYYYYYKWKVPKLAAANVTTPFRQVSVELKFLGVHGAKVILKGILKGIVHIMGFIPHFPFEAPEWGARAPLFKYFKRHSRLSIVLSFADKSSLEAGMYVSRGPDRCGGRLFLIFYFKRALYGRLP